MCPVHCTTTPKFLPCTLGILALILDDNNIFWTMGMENKSDNNNFRTLKIENKMNKMMFCFPLHKTLPLSWIFTMRKFMFRQASILKKQNCHSPLLYHPIIISTHNFVLSYGRVDRILHPATLGHWFLSHRMLQSRRTAVPHMWQPWNNWACFKCNLLPQIS